MPFLKYREFSDDEIRGAFAVFLFPVPFFQAPPCLPRALFSHRIPGRQTSSLGESVSLQTLPLCSRRRRPFPPDVASCQMVTLPKFVM